MSQVLAFLREEDGASAAEYVLILAVLGAGIAAAALAFGGNINTALSNAGDCLTSKGKTGC